MCRASSPRWRAAVAWAALKELDPEDAAKVAAVFLPAGAPLPTLINMMEDARWWAGLASRAERKAYCLAAFESMPEADQAAFLQHVQKARAA